MEDLNYLLDLIETKIPFYQKVNSKVTKTTIGWQIEHSLLVINGITNALNDSDPKKYKWKFNFIKLLVMTRKKIPRGKGKSPKTVLPKDLNDYDSLFKHLQITRNNILKLNNLQKKHYFEHPLFGNLKSKEALDFILIHTKHHLSIINDILID